MRRVVNHIVSDMFPIERSDYLKTYLLEQQEIERLKWLESEKAGHDIGHYRAHWLWLTRHRAAWVSGVRQSQNAETHSQ